MKTRLLILNHETGSARHFYMAGQVSGPEAEKAALEYAQECYPGCSRMGYRPVVVFGVRWAVVVVRP